MKNGFPGMRKMFSEQRKFRKWQQVYNASAPRVGDMAPDFELSDLHGENPVRLADLRGRQPIVLVFGSFT